MGLVVLLDILLLNWLLRYHIRPLQLSFFSFLLGVILLLSVPVLIFIALQSFECLTLSYRLDRNGVVIRWGGSERVVPIRDIQAIIPGDQLGSSVVDREGVRWPGHERGGGDVPGIGQTRFYATRPLTQQLILVTDGPAIAISPADSQGFLQAYGRRRELGPNRLLDRGIHYSRWLTWSLWTDQAAWVLLGAGLFINVGLFGYLFARFPGLDLQLPLHFNSLGQADRIGTKAELFSLPIIGLIIFCANLVLGLLLYRKARSGSYLLWGASAAAQALLWLATFSIVP
jgi:hypothetical protein